MKRKPGKSTAVLKARRQRDRDGHRISVREIAVLTCCDNMGVKRWTYRLYPEAYQGAESGKPVFLTWAEAREVLLKLCQDTKNEDSLYRIQILDALLAREGRP